MKKEVFWYKVGVRTTALQLIIMGLATIPVFVCIGGLMQYTATLQELNINSIAEPLTLNARMDLIQTLALPWLIATILSYLFFLMVVVITPMKTLRQIAAKSIAKQQLRRLKREQATDEETSGILKAASDEGLSLEE